MARNRKIRYRVWSGDFIEKFDTLADASVYIHEMLAAHPEFAVGIELQSYMPTSQGAKTLTTINGVDAILEFIKDSGIGEPEDVYGEDL